VSEDTFSVENGFKKDALLKSFILVFILLFERQSKSEGTKLNGTFQILVMLLSWAKALALPIKS